MDDTKILELIVAFGMSIDASGDIVEVSSNGMGAEEAYFDRSTDKADALRRAVACVFEKLLVKADAQRCELRGEPRSSESSD